MRSRPDPRALALAVVAPALALLVALAISAIALRLNGNAPFGVFRTMVEQGTTGPALVSAVNKAVPYFVSGLAVAVAFRMALFNIGVEGQYRLAALVAAWTGAHVHLPRVLHIAVICLVAVLVGSLWAGIAGVLRVTRGVSEVISTIMLNAIATALGAYLLAHVLLDRAGSSNNLSTADLPVSGQLPSLARPLKALGLGTRGDSVYGFAVIAVLLGVAVSVLLGRTRFGFELRATGLNPFAAAAGGVAARSMVLRTMLLSGGLAGLVGMPVLLGDDHNYGLGFPTGYGFTGIAVALLGRNRPLGIALGALLFGFLERSSQALQSLGVPPEIYVIMQGSIVLSVVVAYEVVRRLGEAQAERRVRGTTDPPPGQPTAGAPAPAGVPA